jgi:hypothetical protein
MDYLVIWSNPNPRSVVVVSDLLVEALVGIMLSSLTVDGVKLQGVNSVPVVY